MSNKSQQALILELETRIKAQDAIIRELRQLRERQWAIQDEHLTLIKELRQASTNQPTNITCPENHTTHPRLKLTP